MGVTPVRDPAPESGWATLAPVLGAIGTGIGVLGLVTFVGGAIQYGRLQATGLPAEEALTVMPTSNLVTVGAITLVPGVVMALLAVAVLFVVRTLAGNVEAMQRTNVSRSRERAIWMGAGVVAGHIFCFGLTTDGGGAVELAVAAPLSLVLATIVAAIAFLTPRFVWLGTATFLAMSIFLGGVGYARARQDADVRPAAVIRDNKQASIGFFVGEANDRVYIGRLPTGGDDEPGGTRLMAFAASQITDFAVGPPVPFDEALKQARDLADELCAEQLPASKKAADCWTTRPGRDAAQ